MNILIAEDNEPEQIIIKEAFKEAKSGHNLYMAKNGIEAIEFLIGKRDIHNVPKIDLVILDLNMPLKNGLEVLTDIKSSPKMKHLPVLIFSNSEYSGDICKCYTLGVNAYLNKPADFQGFVEFAQGIDIFWSKLVRFCVH